MCYTLLCRQYKNPDCREDRIADLQAIIDVQTWYHHQKAIRIHTTHERGNDETIPALVGLVQQAVHSICTQERDGYHVEIPECNLIVLFGLLFGLGELVFVLKGHFVRQPRIGRSFANTNIDRLGDLPSFQKNSHALAEQDHPRRSVAVVHQVQKDNGLHEDIGKYCPDRDTDIVLLVTPMRDVALESKSFEDHMENCNNCCGRQQVDVRIKEDTLEGLEFTAIAARWHGTATGSLLLALFCALADT